MEATFQEYHYPTLSTIYVNKLGLCVAQSPYSDMAVIQTLEQLFIPKL